MYLVNDICFQAATAGQGRRLLIGSIPSMNYGSMDTATIMPVTPEISTQSDVLLIELTGGNTSD